ncbi:TnsA-like heteromeric transposase endonuclease subunit [Dactylosporangium sp. McL0621]|uniref:TnsA-like heteromeric transposase endonuclease subunit n=1 Tax=Dactylosporangium sp. McL0621 TaxID=3415678 RepID=UPI003CF35931
MGWEYRLVGAPDPIVTANLRWLSGYRHPRHELPGLAVAFRAAFAEPVPLLAGAEAVGDPIAVLPVLFHLLWRHDLTADLSVPLHPCSSVTTAVAGLVAV